MKIALTVSDRLVLHMLLGALGGSYDQIKLAEFWQNRLFSQEDMRAYQVVTSKDNLTSWSLTSPEGKGLPAVVDYDFPPEAYGMIRRTLTRLNEAEALERQQKTLYELFVVAKHE
jgi:hypothetical protein